MATRTLTTKLTLDGEREYKSAVNNINSALGVLNSELKKTTAEYQDNANSVEALSKKGDVLERKLLTQKEKVEQLKAALEHAKNEYGESSEKTMAWEKKLNDAETAVFNTEAAIKKNNEALEEAKNKTDENTMSLSDLAEQFGIHLPDGAKKALSSVGDFSVGSVAAIGAVAVAIKETIDLVQKLIETTKEVAAYVDDLCTTAVKSGIDTYTLQVLNYMEDLADVDVSTVTSSMAKLTKTMASAAEGTASAQEAFAALGVNVTNADGSLREASDVLWECIDALGQIDSQTQRDAAAMEIFGKKAQELNTLIAVGSGGFKAYAKEAENVGYIMDTKTLQALNDYKDALDRAEKQQEALKQQMSAQLAPSLKQLTEAWSHLKTEGLQIIIDSGIIEFLGGVVEHIGYVVKAVGDMFETLNALMHPIESLKELFGIQNTTLEQNAALTTASTAANQEHMQMSIAQTSAINSTTAALNTETAAFNQTASAALSAAQAIRQFAAASGVDLSGYSDARLEQLGAWSPATSEHGAGFLGEYVDYTRSDFKKLLEQNNITSARQISSILGENAYYYYLATNSYNAAGDYNYRGGTTWVGENGPELVSLPQGSRIYSNQESKSMNGDTYNITIDAKNIKELNDIVRMVKYSRVTERMA